MPKILLSCQKSSDPSAYLAALSHVGCEPAENFEECDGVLLCGGGDLSPQFYTYRSSLGCINIEDPARDAYEFELIRRCVATAKPLLGICRGMQVINVFYGGNLIEDLSDSSKKIHKNSIHPVEILPDSQLYAILGSTCSVSSFHHQAVDQPGNALQTTAYAPDGVCEAIEHETLPILGVQWHPERTEDLRIFTYFAQLAQKFRRSL